jgi:NADH-quinone oxidoreductase subunit G
MAAVATGVQTVTITINDIEIQVPKGELIVESVKRIGLEVPVFCYHPRMKPVGMCRMCLVEIGTKMPDGTIRKFPKPQTACSLPASDNLVIYTDTQAVHTDRRGVLEFLLVNHPLDCPICDRGGECPLQNNTLFYGPSTSRFVEMKRHAPKAFPLSQYVTLDLERCIQCGRCVRFTEEISGDAQLAFRFRGAQMQPSTFQLTDFDSKFSGNVIEICPVGALTSSKYRFRARPWDLQTKPGICTLCSNGCNVYVDYRKGEVVRINGRTNEAVNEEWTCDKGKFGHYKFQESDRVKTPFVRRSDAMAATEWSDAYAEILQATRGKKVAGLISGALSNEDHFTFKSLLQNGFSSNDVDYRFEKHLLKEEPTTVREPLAEIEAAQSVLVFGTSLADEEPILFLRLRKGWFNHGTKIVVAYPQSTDVDSFAHTLLRYAPGTEADLAIGLRQLKAGTGDVDAISKSTGVPSAALLEAVSVLAEAKIITTRGIYDLSQGPEVERSLNELANELGGTYSRYARLANEEGATQMNLASSEGRNTHEILTACANGEIDVLWLAGLNLFDLYHDRDLVTRALETVEFLIVQDWQRTEATEYASVILPMAAPTEYEGSYTNLEGRVQTFRQVFEAPGHAKAPWKAFNELSLRLNPGKPLFQASDVLGQIADAYPEFAAQA